VYPSLQGGEHERRGLGSSRSETAVEPSQILFALIAAATLGILATLVILRRERKEAEAAAPHESRFAASTEGEKRCPHCGMGNLWTDARCVSCRRPLPG
jgi:hypothetical protein